VRKNTMITHLPAVPIPNECTLDIKIHVTQPLNVTSFSARQRVTQYVMHQLSTQLGGDAPELTVAERVYWTVPVVFTLPGKGVLGRVGTLRVDAGTGELLSDPQTEQDMVRNAEQLAQRAALSAGV
jgi:hypothetical protein